MTGRQDNREIKEQSCGVAGMTCFCASRENNKTVEDAGYGHMEIKAHDRAAEKIESDISGVGQRPSS